MKIVVAHLAGGLGNQLFQYANARALAYRHKAKVALDLSFYSHYKLHAYGLHHFNIQASIASPFQTRTLKGLVGKIHDSIVPEDKHWQVREKHFHFVPNILQLKPPLYLEGYWQSEKYFEDCIDLIRGDLSIVTPMTKENESMMSKIKDSSAISLHIRRGDYASNKQAEAVHGLIPVAFYREAAQRVSAAVKDSVFYVFSDDPEWAHENLGLEYETVIVNINGPDKNYEDLRLMSACKHHIIANSTFSWWGAWLNPNPDKVVIAPNPWFRTSELNAKDVLPASWIKQSFKLS